MLKLGKCVIEMRLKMRFEKYLINREKNNEQNRLNISIDDVRIYIYRGQILH